MQRPKRILVPIDLSERSEAAVAYAAMVAETTGAEIVVMANVSHPERQALAPFAKANDVAVDEAARLVIEGIIANRAPGAQTSIVLCTQASPVDAILETAANESADLIVLTSHGRSGVGRLMVGSVAEKIIRTAPIPVTLVPTRNTKA